METTKKNETWSLMKTYGFWIYIILFPIFLLYVRNYKLFYYYVFSYFIYLILILNFYSILYQKFYLKLTK